MFLTFFDALRRAGVPVGPRELLDLLGGLAAGLCAGDVTAFHAFARAVLVKDERYYDRFDRAFAEVFGTLDTIPEAEVMAALDLPEDWLRKLAERSFSAEEKAAVAALGGFEALMRTLRERLAEQKERHQGGNKWIGTAGTSPFGAYGYNPEGVRIGQAQSRHRRAVKVWDRREFQDLDEERDISARNVKVALRRLRIWAREGAAEELDLDGTIRASAKTGWIDVQTRPERRNAVKVLLLLDIGGSMDDHVETVQELFTAARSEFRHIEIFYFHNCIYEALWKSARRRRETATPTREVMNRLGRDWRCVIVGDASMSPYEITHVGGANETWNPEPGALWLQRIRAQWPRSVWLNPVPRAEWKYTPSISMIGDIFEGDMLPLTLEGLGRMTKVLG